MKFRKKPVVIEAVQLTEKLCWDYWLLRISGPFGLSISGSYHPLDKKIYWGWIILKGDMKAEIGDWIIKEENGKLSSLKNDIFEATYEKVEP